MLRLFVLQANYVYSTFAFRCIFNIKFNSFTVVKSLVITKVFNVVSVNENVIPSFIRSDKSKSFLSIEKFYFALL